MIPAPCGQRSDDHERSCNLESGHVGYHRFIPSLDFPTIPKPEPRPLAPRKIPLSGTCPKCGHNAGYALAYCGVASTQSRILLPDRRGANRIPHCGGMDGEHVHRICKVCGYDDPVPPIDLEQKVVGR